MTPDTLADLLGAAAAVPRLLDAACRGRTEMADIEIRSSRTEIDAAIEVCMGCRELQGCSSWVDLLPVGQRPAGVVAGRLVVDPAQMEHARRAMTAELAARRPKPAAARYARGDDCPPVAS
jgi:hypothetical protein